MNYDKAYELAKAMRESDEYKALMEAQKLVEQDEASLGMVRQFLTQQVQWEYAKIAQSADEEELLKKQEELVLLINNNSLAREYLQAHVRWSQISQDIYRIISEPITEGMKILEERK